MRISIALAIYVSLAGGAFADDIANDWAALHGAALRADEHHDFEQALALLRQSWTSAQSPEQQGVSANDIGQTYRQLRQLRNAKEWLERAYGIWRAHPGAGRYFSVTTASLGDVYRDTGDYIRAEAFFREALGADSHNPDTADAIRNNLADLLREEGRPAEARELFSTSLCHDAVSLSQRVNALIGLADIDRQQGDREASVREWNEVIALASSHGDEMSEAIGLRGLAELWLSTGNLARAEPLLHRSLALMENDPAAAPQDVAGTLFSLAELYRARNKLALAQEALSKALELDRAAFGDLHPQVAAAMEMLAEVYSQLGERKPARDYATTAVESMTCMFGENGLPTAVALANRAGVEQVAGDLEGSVKDYARAFAITREHPRNNVLEKTLIERYAALLKAMHRNREAKEISTLSFRD